MASISSRRLCSMPWWACTDMYLTVPVQIFVLMQPFLITDWYINILTKDTNDAASLCIGNVLLCFRVNVWLCQTWWLEICHRHPMQQQSTSFLCDCKPKSTTCKTFSFIRSLRPIRTFSGFISLQMFQISVRRKTFKMLRWCFPQRRQTYPFFRLPIVTHNLAWD